MKTIKLLIVFLLSIVIASCGGGGGGGGTAVTQTLSGTAAQGAAITNVIVTIKDKNGNTKTGTTGTTDGKYLIDVTGMAAPFLLRVPAGTGYLYSVATASGTANIHPFTDLIIRNWYKVQVSNVETDFSGTSALAKVPTATEINTIEAVVRSILSTYLTNVGITTSNFNLLSSSFDANHTGFDKVLDNTQVVVSTAGAVTVTATDPTTGITGTMVSTDSTINLAAADTTKPTDPSGLSAIPASTTSIMLVWNASTDNVGVAGYNIYRGGSKIGTSPYPVYSDTGLTSSTNYCYQVEAFDGAVNVSAGKSASLCATTLAVADTIAPSAPTSLTATAASASQIDLSWNTSTDNFGVAGYAIYRGGVKVASVNGTSTSYSDTGLSSGTPYSYTVKALDGALNLSAVSNTASATTQAATASNYAGTYSGAVTVNSVSSGTFSVIVDSAGGMTGSMTINGGTGTLSSGQVTTSGIVSFMLSGKTDTYSGTIDAATGAFSAACSSGCIDSVTFAGTKQTTGVGTGTHNASGTYTWDSTTLVLTHIFTSSDFICDGPLVGWTGTKTGVIITSTTMTADGGDTFTRSSGAAGDILGAWIASDSTTGNSFAYTFNADGTLSLTANIASCAAFPIANTSLREMSASAAFDGTNFLVGIQGDATAVQDITAQFVSKTGALVGSPISTGGTGGAPGVAFDGTNYLLVWEQDATYSTAIYGQFVSMSGALVGTQFTIASGYNNIKSMTQVIFDGTNYFVAWDNEGTPCSGTPNVVCGGDTKDVYGQFVTPSGATLGSVIPVSTAVHGQRDPFIAFDGTNILVAWTDGRNQSACFTNTVQGTFDGEVYQPGTHCFESDIYGQFITKSGASAAGALSGSNFQIDVGTLPRDSSGPGVAFDGTNYLITYTEETTLPNACSLSGCIWETYGILVSKAGAAIGSRFVLGNPAINHKFFPLPAYLGTKYLVTWTDGMGTTSASVKGQYVTTSGAVSGSEFTLFSPDASGAVPWLGMVFTGGGVNLAVMDQGIPDPTNPANIDLYTNADVMGSIITTP